MHQKQDGRPTGSKRPPNGILDQERKEHITSPPDPATYRVGFTNIATGLSYSIIRCACFEIVTMEPMDDEKKGGGNVQ